MKDIFLIILIRDISKWYDKWYMGNLHAMKSLHIEMLISHYDPKRFRECENLYKERIKFLAEVQKLVDTYVSNGGCDSWMT